ncbi:MAG: hypothetical protein ABIZ50_00050 [Solirubrobacterales bacterium]
MSMSMRQLWANARGIKQIVRRAADEYASQLAPSDEDPGHPSYLDAFAFSDSLVGQYVSLWYARTLTAAEVEGLTDAIREGLRECGIADFEVELVVSHGWGDLVHELAQRDLVPHAQSITEQITDEVPSRFVRQPLGSRLAVPSNKEATQ